MPELPEVETIKEALKKAITDVKIVSVTIRNRRFRELIPDDFESIVSNSYVKNVWRKAKYAIIDLDNGYSIIWHFGMSGKVKIVDKPLSVYEKHDHVIFNTSIGEIIFNDTRRFGLITYTKTLNINTHHLFKNMGLEPFDDKLDANYLLDKFKNKKLPIKVALLDQRIVNGIGNIYASEALYLARISPFRECNLLSKEELTLLIKSIRTTLNKAIKAGGSTLRDYRKPDGSTGYFQNQHCVYNKTGQRCPNCTCDINKTKGIKKIVQGGRSTFYCETLQQ
ncbi:MAG: bifunctional DNA-formamidopyrimidine glycosylase/DNA-(apurinic or apyrimidinic site) lyase [Alphaproteobacteria bacterium]|nr:bifunctional DNA-formamidopyrimidine glycosylase/DNA-(apurinic or apyrimidinic site) lyase [Alphaproteobacteria bacterium]